MPFATIHFAGDLSLAETHSSRFLPSNKMIASEGGAVLSRPGVTTLGIGSHTSVSSGFSEAGAGLVCWVVLGGAGSCARRRGPVVKSVATVRKVQSVIRIVFTEYVFHDRVLRLK